MKAGAWRKSPAIKRSYHDTAITYQLEKYLKRLDTINPLTYALEDLQRVKNGRFFTYIRSRRLETEECPHLMSWSWSGREVNQGWSGQTLSSYQLVLGELFISPQKKNRLDVDLLLHLCWFTLLPWPLQHSCTNSPEDAALEPESNNFIHENVF